MQTINYIYNSEGKKTGVFLNYDNLNEKEVINFEKILKQFITLDMNKLSVTKKNIKKSFIEAIKNLQKNDIFKKIEDPVKWQKEIRNEWV